MGGEENLEKCRKTTFQAVAGKASNLIIKDSKSYKYKYIYIRSKQLFLIEAFFQKLNEFN